MDVLLAGTGGSRRVRIVQGPLGRPVKAAYALLDSGRTAVIEMAAASGLALVAPEERDVRRASTYGTGELMRAALDERVGRTGALLRAGPGCSGDSTRHESPATVRERMAPTIRDTTRSLKQPFVEFSQLPAPKLPDLKTSKLRQLMTTLGKTFRGGARAAGDYQAWACPGYVDSRVMLPTYRVVLQAQSPPSSC